MKTTNRNKKNIIILLMIGLLGLAACSNKIKRIKFVLHLFDEDKIVENFRSIKEVFPVSTLEKSSIPYQYEKGKQFELPISFKHKDEEIETQYFLEGSKTTGFLVIQDNKIVYENYYLGNTADTQNISWSVAKSFISALFGIAMDEGYIKNISQTVDEYVPELKGSGYEGVKIKDVLQMSSGIKFDEDYSKFSSDINKWGRAFAFGKSQDKFASKMKRERTPGFYNKYVSIDTHVLSMVIRNATGRTITDYMQEKLWEPLGMEYNAYWGIDNNNVEVALCGLNATLRDFAKLGTLYANKGEWNGIQLISEEWIINSTTANEKHLIPGTNENSAHELGYGYQWWLVEGNQGEFMAQGVYNQNIYVNPSTNTVVVKLSANDKFNDESYLPSQWQTAVSFYREIVESLNPNMVE